MTCISNLKQIGLALLNYEQTYGRLPPAAVADKQGNAMHSWRTLILPYLERSDSYRAYSVREPWNGPNNSKLAGLKLSFFDVRRIGRSNDRPTTSYVAVTGPGTVWDDLHHREAAAADGR